MLALFIVYVISLAICIVRAKVEKDSGLALVGFIPFLNIFFAVAVLLVFFLNWIEE